MIIFLFMNLIVIATSFLITFRLLRFSGLVDGLLCWFVFYFAQIILSELFLGILGILYLENLILTNLAVMLLVLLAAKDRPSAFNPAGMSDKIRAFLNNKTMLFPIVVIASFALVKVAVNLINPPLGWDCLNYHFTFPVEWLKHGNLDTPMVVSDDPFPAYYPINGSLFFLWLIFPFKSAFLADIGQLPFFIISFLAILSIGNKLGLKSEYSFLAACLFVMIPNFFKQLQIGYIDIMVAGLFFTALNFLLRLKEKNDIKNIILFAIATGIFIGLKTIALPYSIFLLVPFLLFVLLRKRITLKVRAGYLILALAGISIFGCYSYLKNFILTGNPFYPLTVSALGKVIFKGVIEKGTFIARNVPGDYSLSKLLFHEGLGVQSLLIIFPGAISVPWINLLKLKNKNIFLNYIIFLPLLLYLTYRFILPIPNSRYLYPMLGIGMVVGFYFLDSIKMPLKVIKITAIVCTFASAAECARHLELVFSLGLSFLIFGFSLLYLRYKRLRPIIFSKGFVFLVILISLILFEWASFDYKKNEYGRYINNSPYWPDATRAWAWLNEHTAGNKVAYVGRPVPYPLYGSDLKNDIYYVSVNTHDPIQLHDLKYSNYLWDNNAENMHRDFEQANNYRGNANYTVWLGNLERRETDFLFIYSLHHTKNIIFPMEELWAKGHPDRFVLVFSNETISIYRLKK